MNPVKGPTGGPTTPPRTLSSPYRDSVLSHKFVSFPGTAAAMNDPLPNGDDGAINVPTEGSWIHKHENEMDDNTYQTLAFLLTNRIAFFVDSNGSLTISPKKPKPEPLPIEELVKRARNGTTDISDFNK